MIRYDDSSPLILEDLMRSSVQGKERNLEILSLSCEEEYLWPAQ